jgi:hypothetical protein
MSERNREEMKRQGDPLESLIDESISSADKRDANEDPAELQDDDDEDLQNDDVDDQRDVGEED